MFICDNLVHPFQNEPGTSQRQRIMDDLLSGSAKIDGRSMADLLDYFVSLSRHINYYNTDLSISDWQPFFQKSIPFALASIIKYDTNAVTKKIDAYSKTFDKRPSKGGLQLLFQYFFQQVINRVNTWNLQLKDSGLPAEFIIEKLIKDKLREPLRNFVRYNNVAVKLYCVKPINFLTISQNPVWDLNLSELSKDTDKNKPAGNTKRKRLIALRNSIKDLLPSFLDAIRIISDTAAQSMEQSLFPLKEELQKQHTPHLALLFAFLKLFSHLQGDLNTYTKRHLDFFYKQVLKLKARDAVADKAHIVFEIQKQLDKYLLKKGLLVKDGKDSNKAEILFSLEDEIVVNKTQVADKRTLFLNNQDAFEKTYVEGVYMAPNVDKADGVIKDFKDTDPKSFATLGARLSKFTDPENKFLKPYPNARLGFILASPVLLLNEGTRTIDISIACQLNEDYCRAMNPPEDLRTNNCCEEETPGIPGTTPPPKLKYPDFIDAPGFYADIVAALNETWYYISQDLVNEAVKKGISKDVEIKLRSLLTEIQTKTNSPSICYCPVEIKKYDSIIKQAQWNTFHASANIAEKAILTELIKPRKALRVYFSGEKEWIEPVIDPMAPSTITMSPPPLVGNKFLLTIKAVLGPEIPAVSFYNKDALKEDFNTTLPLVKVELDDKIKLFYTDANPLKSRIENREQKDDVCCLLNDPPGATDTVSLYHFFRNVTVLDKISNDLDATRIDVRVCGLKNFIVQNNESVQDVNSPIYPFGTRPDVPDFSVETISKVYAITQELIDDAQTAGVSNATLTYLSNLLGPKKVHRLKSQLDDFLATIPNAADKPLLQGVFNDPTKKYFKLNLVGPDFYIGSKEIFCKKWNETFININWKEKPVDFNEYYKAYYVDPTNFSKYGINEENFQINIAVLDNGTWRKENVHALLNPPPPGTVINADTEDNNRPLFKNDILAPFCETTNPIEQTIHVSKAFFDSYVQEFRLTAEEIKRYNTDTPFGFLRINLQNQDFLHKNYPFVLARQMMALGKFPKEFLEDATYLDAGGTVFVFESTAGKLVELDQLITKTLTDATDARNTAQTLNSRVSDARDAGSDGAEDITDDEFTTSIDINTPLQATVTNTDDARQGASDTRAKYTEIKNTLSIFDFFTGEVVKKLAVLIPNEPWTPIIKNISLDYTATAINTDIDLIHLYPYDGTYKKENITLKPALFPTYCDEGNLFIGLKDLEPGSNVNMLFQLAEATADSESDREEVNWHYLDNNQWKTLRRGFEILDDATDGLTTSGIVKFALPQNMTKDNTILPKDLHWIKASIPKNSKTVSETIGIYTQAILAVFTNDTANDKLRLSTPLSAGAISKLNEADANVKKLTQPHDSFGGRKPEAEGHFYLRVSELLRHKGRAIQKFDYERLALELFPQLFKVKCINHSFGLNAHQYKNDFPVAPGYVLLAVIPDLNQLKAAQSFEPRVPVSMLDDIQEQLRKLTSPFVRFRAMNPRYEKIHFCLKVKLLPGKDENYYKEKMKQDLREFLAPWAIGEYDKLTFGQCVSRSEIIQFLESRDYIDYIIDLLMRHNDAPWPNKNNEDELSKPVCPRTPRSILIAGNIDVCIASKDCETWEKCFDAQRREIDCCENKKIPITDYCIRDVIG